MKEIKAKEKSRKNRKKNENTELDNNGRLHVAAVGTREDG